jgi:hypothetical protein
MKRGELFVGRWGVFGPELFLVGKRVRRLSPGLEPGGPTVAFARQILAEVMRCRPATRLAHAFAAARLRHLPEDGFVLPAADVEDWLDASSG